jgi:hypothetical protein
MIGRVGYDLHITRAVFWPESDRYPILGSEVADLVRGTPGLTVPPGRAQLPGPCWINGDTPERDALWFHNYQLQSKHPRPEFRRRMIELAARLDAWVVGDDGEVYDWDGTQVISWQRGPAAFAVDPRYLTRGTASSGLNHDAAIRPDEWAEVAAAQPDFTTMTRIEATLPSGVREIPCLPVPAWTGHPSGRPVPFYFERDLIEVRNADGPTIARMKRLATALNAKVLTYDDEPG